ncbi:hypothetical protein HUJ04_000059 [Dendroctonus ponderosae]|nr:hypothetical protein HUJ04_000059 [Dendroctonus ponderosae]
MPQTSLQKASVQQPANITKGKPVRPCGFGASHLEPPVRGTVQRHGAGNAPDKDRNSRVGRALTAQAVASRTGFRLNLPGRLAGLIASVAVNEQGRAGPKAHTWPRTDAPTPCERVSGDRAGEKLKKNYSTSYPKGRSRSGVFHKGRGLGERGASLICANSSGARSTECRKARPVAWRRLLQAPAPCWYKPACSGRHGERANHQLPRTSRICFYFGALRFSCGVFRERFSLIYAYSKFLSAHFFKWPHSTTPARDEFNWKPALSCNV